MFTDQDPDKEDPQLFWRRDAILTIGMEKKVFVFRYLEQTLVSFLPFLLLNCYFMLYFFIDDITVLC